MGDKPDMIMDLRHIDWDEKLWERFVRRIKKKVYLSDCEEMGVLSIQNLRNRSAFDTQVLVKGFLSDYLDKYRPISLNICDVGRQQVTLPLIAETESNAYLFYCTRLAILKTDSSAAKRVLRYFLDLRLFYNKAYMNFLFFEEELENMLVLQNVEYREIAKEGNIVDFVRKKLCDGAYVNVQLDEFYIAEKDYYDKRHFVHENFIYGFDDERQLFYAYGITERQQTAEFVITYEELLLSYEKGKLFYFCGAEYLEWEGYYPVTVNRIGQVSDCEFTEEIFREKIHAFLNPPESDRVEGDIHVYGKNVYEWILQDLTGENVRKIVDYRLIHLLYEHKCCIRNRLEYLQQAGGLSDSGQKLYVEIKRVIEDFQRIRLLYLKQLKKEGKLMDMNRAVENMYARKQIAEQLADAVKKEAEILGRMFDA